MPHILIEHSANLRAPAAEALGALHDLLVPIGPFGIDDFKSRVIRCETYRVGDGDASRAFVHATVGVLDRRSDEVQVQVADATLAWLRATFTPSLGALDADLTVEVRAMRASLYRKARPAQEPA